MDEVGAVPSAQIAFEDDAQSALRLSEARFRAAVQAVHGVMWTNDSQGQMMGEQAGWSRLTGQTRAEYEGFGWAQAVHPDDAQPTVDAWLSAVGERRPFVFEHRLRIASGEWRLFSVRAVPVLDDDGEIREWVGVHTDITAIRDHENAIRAERDRMWCYFEQAPSFMAVLRGERHVFELVNPAYRQIVGHRDVIGLELREAFPEAADQGDGDARFFDIYDRIFATGEPYVGHGLRVEIQRRPGGPMEERFIDVVMQPIRDLDGAVSGIFVNGIDITHRKRAEGQLHRLNEELEERVLQRSEELTAAQTALFRAQRLEALGKLTGGVAHDFNNLLQVVSGNLQLLAQDVKGSERAEKRVQNALAGVARGAKLASQLLAFGRRQPLEPKVVHLGKLIRNMDDLLCRAIGEEIQVQTVVASGLWNTLIDPGQIENAVLNLAINARDAMPDGGCLTIEVANTSLDDAYTRQNEEVSPGDYVMIAVSDTGSGIPAEVLDTVFEPFFSTKPEGKGTGLGLSMVHGLTKQSGGHIKIYSEEGEGTTIRLYLPRAVEAEDVLTDINGGPVRGGDETILVVEDDDDVRDTTVSLLNELGYSVLRAHDAQSALNVINSGVHIDLLFTDVVMPGKLRSPEMARKAKERRPELAVLFTSGYTENAIVHHGRLDSGVELLSKPYTREALATKVRHVLANEAQKQLAAAAAQGADQGQFRAGAKLDHSAGRLTVLLVEDDALIRQTTAEILKQAGHAVIESGDATSAERLLTSNLVDLLLTDIGLPDDSGVELARRARTRLPTLRVVFACGDDSLIANAGLQNATTLLKPYSANDLLRALALTPLASPNEPRERPLSGKV